MSVCLSFHQLVYLFICLNWCSMFIFFLFNVCPCCFTHCQQRISSRWGIYELPHDKTNKMTVCPAKTQISLGICPVWSDSLLSAWRKLGSLATHWPHSEDSDQTGRMPRLIRPVWSESLLGAHSFCWFYHEVAHIPGMYKEKGPFSHEVWVKFKPKHKSAPLATADVSIRASSRENLSSCVCDQGRLKWDWWD